MSPLQMLNSFLSYFSDKPSGEVLLNYSAATAIKENLKEIKLLISRCYAGDRAEADVRPNY